jgi:hypothetical protein
LHLVGLALAVGFAVFIEDLGGFVGEQAQAIVDLVEAHHRLGRMQLFKGNLDHLPGLGRRERLGLKGNDTQQQCNSP